MMKSLVFGTCVLGAVALFASGCASEQDDATGSTSAAQTTAEVYKESYQLECHVPVGDEEVARDALNALSNIGGCAVGAIIGFGEDLTGVLLVAGVATFAATCGGAVVAVVDAVRQRGGSCVSLDKAAESCNAQCRDGGLGYYSLTGPVDQPDLTYCGCGSSQRAVQCRTSCASGFASATGCSCASGAPSIPLDDCGNGPSAEKCWLEDGRLATTVGGTNVMRRTHCKLPGEFAEGKDGFAYECAQSCSTSPCVPGSAWTRAVTVTPPPPAPPTPAPNTCSYPANRVQDVCASLGQTACLGSSTCCWSDLAAPGGKCQYPGEKSSARTCQCNGSYQ